MCQRDVLILLQVAESSGILKSKEGGDTVDYEQLKTLSETEKSSVYLVFDSEQQRVLVEKHLVGEVAVYQKLLKLRHPYLPKIESVRFEHGETIVIEEYISGGSLAQIKADERQLSRWLLELCEVLEFLHSSQIIHRDIKPSNLLLGEDGHIRLIDFDAAREQKESADNDTRLLGTRGYAPPEQYGFAQTDRRADIYSVGVTWKTLLGKRAESSTYRKILRKCTDLAPKKRYASAKSLALAWRMRNFARYLPWIYAALVVLAVWIGWNEYQEYQASLVEYTQVSYPEEALLLRTIEGQHMLAQVSALYEQGERHTIKIDLDLDGKRETLELKEKIGTQRPCIILTGGDSKKDSYGGDILHLLGSYFPVGTYMGQGDDNYSWVEDDTDYIQVTCLDLDELVADNTGVELLITIGDGKDHVVTAVFSYDPSMEIPLLYRGFMWGSSFIRQTESGSFEGMLRLNPYLESNLYYYGYEGMQEILGVDFHDYWNYFEMAWPMP